MKIVTIFIKAASDMFNWVVNRPLKIMKFSRSEAATQSCSVKKVFLEISQSSQQNTSARVSF